MCPPTWGHLTRGFSERVPAKNKSFSDFQSHQNRTNHKWGVNLWQSCYVTWISIKFVTDNVSRSIINSILGDNLCNLTMLNVDQSVNQIFYTSVAIALSVFLDIPKPYIFLVEIKSSNTRKVLLCSDHVMWSLSQLVSWVGKSDSHCMQAFTELQTLQRNHGFRLIITIAQPNGWMDWYFDIGNLLNF